MSAETNVFKEITRKFEEKSGLSGIQSELLERGDNSVLLLKIAHPSERLFEILEQIRHGFSDGDTEAPTVTLVKAPSGNLLLGPEGKLFLKTLAESLNINRYSFGADFLARYTNSVTGSEEQITAAANHIVFGRRGSGKSTLLLYSLHSRKNSSRPSVWVDMQVYARRNDDGVIADVLCEVLRQISPFVQRSRDYEPLLTALRQQVVDERFIRLQLPRLRLLLSQCAEKNKGLFVFLDDFHVLVESLQPTLLDILYAVSRGNRVFLKLSAIETLTRTFDTQTRQGLELPHDAQLIRLDYNLTIPDKATQHIDAILASHAVYCGLPSVRRLCTSADVIPRLTWVAAGVPRDALNLFSQAMTRATGDGRRHVSVSNVNVAASEALNTKIRELKVDVSNDARHPLEGVLEDIREFCVKTRRSNAFLVEITSDSGVYEQVRKLVDLRLLHVISEGITIGEAGRKYLGLVLDYGFYTGIRAAQSVDLFNRQTARVAYKDLRKLPVFSQ